MQVLIAIIVMGLIGAAAVVAVAAAAVVRFLPLLLVALLVLGALRWWERRTGRPPAPGPPAPRPPLTVPRPGSPPRPRLSYPDAWLVVPVWMDARGRPRGRPVLDVEVIGVDEHHG